MSARVALWGVAAAVVAYLLFPLAVVVLLAFSDGSFLAFPPPGWSLRWFRELLAAPEWRTAYRITLEVGTLTALLSVALGVPAAFALVRWRIRWRAAFDALLLAVLVAPPIIRGIALYLAYVPFGLQDTRAGLVAAHAATGLPYVILNVTAALMGFNRDLERAAIVHGAHPLFAVLTVTLPLVLPAVIVGALFAFLQSAQELLVTMFVFGTVERPLAVLLWQGVRMSLQPVIAAASASFIALALLAFALAALIERQARRSRVRET